MACTSALGKKWRNQKMQLNDFLDLIENAKKLVSI
jgi:hypothetical protein